MYPGVYYVSAAGANGRFERIYYICYRNDGKLIEELAGNQSQDNMTAEAAAQLRLMRLQGDASTNRRDREHLSQIQEVWTFDRLWETYKAHRPGLKGLRIDENRYQNHLKLPFGEREPKSLTPLELDRLGLDLLNTRRPATVSNVLELLRRLANFAAKKRLCETLSFTIEMPRVNKCQDRRFDPAGAIPALESLGRGL